MSNKSKKEYHVNYYRTAEYKKLQAEWYDKLKDTGFIDLEWLDKKSGAGHSTPFLKQSNANLLKVYDKDVENHFRHARNFLTHGNFTHKRKWKRYKVLWSLYCDGYSYREMIPEIKKQARLTVSVFWISTHINRIKAEMALFDATDAEGIRDYEDV